MSSALSSKTFLGVTNTNKNTSIREFNGLNIIKTATFFPKL